MNPSRGENAPTAIDSKSASCRAFSFTWGSSIARSSQCLRSGPSKTRSTNLPPWGRTCVMLLVLPFSDAWNRSSWNAAFGLFPPAPGPEATNQLEIVAGIAGIANGAIIPVDIRDGLCALSSIVPVLIDFVVWDFVLGQVRCYLLLASRCVDDNFPALRLEFTQGPNHIISRIPEDTGALPA